MPVLEPMFTINITQGQQNHSVKFRGESISTGVRLGAAAIWQVLIWHSCIAGEGWHACHPADMTIPE